MNKQNTINNLKERGFNVLAARVERGTMTAAAAMARAAELERGTADSIAAAYVVNEAVKGAARAAHQLENYSGGVDMFRQLAQEAERQTAQMLNGVSFPFVSAVNLDSTNGGGDTLPDVMDMVQSAAVGIMENGGYMTGRGGCPIVNGKRRGADGKHESAARTETYSYTHKAATSAAAVFAHRQSKAAAEMPVGVETSAAAVKAAARREMDGATADGTSGGVYTIGEKDGGGIAACVTACGGVPFNLDVVNALIHFDGDGMPTNRAVAVWMLAHLDSMSEYTRKAVDRISERRRVDAVAARVGRAYEDIARRGGAAARAALIAAIAENKHGNVRFFIKEK